MTDDERNKVFASLMEESGLAYRMAELLERMVDRNARHVDCDCVSCCSRLLLDKWNIRMAVEDGFWDD